MKAIEKRVIIEKVEEVKCVEIIIKALVEQLTANESFDLGKKDDDSIIEHEIRNVLDLFSENGIFKYNGKVIDELDGDDLPKDTLVFEGKMYDVYRVCLSCNTKLSKQHKGNLCKACSK